MKLVYAKEMQDIDKKASTDFAVPSLLLMDQAARAVASVVAEDYTEGKVVIFCGKGNNGGDGFGIARWLLNQGVRTQVFLVGAAPADVSGDAKYELQMCLAAGGKLNAIATDDDWLLAEVCAARADVLVDALLGTGFNGELRADYKRATALMNSLQKHVVAVDVPTGVNVDNGSADEDAVRADVTVCLALPKPGLLLYPACEHCGELLLADIGMPEKLLREYPSQKFMLNNEIIRELLPVRAGNAHKGSAGRVTICAGSPGFTGAAALAANACVKAGAGLVSLLTPASCQNILAIKLMEVMVHGLLERMPGVLGGGAVSDILKFANSSGVLAIGPGLGTSENTQNVICEVLAKAEVPVVIDADALTAVAGNIDVLKNMQAPKVLTPHPGEMARLTGLSVEEVESKRLELAVQYAKEWQAVVVLKGAPTVIGCPDGTVYVNTTGTSALATGGSGDVLTGMIAGLAVQGISLQEAALCGVYLHGLAGRLACADYGLAAGELANHLQAARAEVNEHDGSYALGRII